MAKIDITVGNRVVIVEADEPLDVVACVALDLFRQAQAIVQERPALEASIGFTTETTAKPTYEDGYQLWGADQAYLRG